MSDMLAIANPGLDNTEQNVRGDVAGPLLAVDFEPSDPRIEPITILKLGIRADAAAHLAEGCPAWGTMQRGDVEILAYFQLEGNTLTAAVLSATNSGRNSLDLLKALLGFREQSVALAQQLGASSVRLQGDVVVNKGIEKILRNRGFKEIPGSAGSWALTTPIKPQTLA